MKLCCVAEADGEAKGTITFPEVSHEVEDDGTEYNVSRICRVSPP
jgi:hypothetical protein